MLAPIPRNGEWPLDDNDQIAWEAAHLAVADVIAMWDPQDLETLSGFTPNVEFGEWLNSGRLLYVHPANASKTSYLDARYRTVNAKQKPPFQQLVGSSMIGPAGHSGWGGGAVDGRRAAGSARGLADSQFQAWYGYGPKWKCARSVRFGRNAC